MPQDMFLHLSGIAGESRDSVHLQTIDVLNCKWGVSHPAELQQGRRSEAGKAHVDDFVFEHYMDRASPNLMAYCLTGKRISLATFIVRKLEGASFEYLTIRMRDVLVTQVSPLGLRSMATPREEVALSFGYLEQEYVVAAPNHGCGGAVRFAFDIKQNRAS
jgi:type VI secretion system secreted protein Hcp